MKNYSRVIILSLTLVIIGCDDDQENFSSDAYDNSGTSSVEAVSTTPPSPVSLRCDTGECPSSVTHIRIGENSSCSGTLIDKNKVLTARHCFRDMDRNECSKTRFYFRQNNGKTYESKCKRIERKSHSSSPILSNTHDYIEVEIDTDHGIRPVRTTRLGRGPRGRVRTTQYVDSRTAKIVSMENCEVLNDHIYEENTAVKIITKCPLYPGNSGGAFLSLRGELSGVIVGKLNKSDILSSMKNAFSIPSTENFGIILDYECVRDSGYCGQKISRKEKVKIVSNEFIDFHAELRKELNYPPIAFTFSPSKGHLIPLCVHGSSERFEMIKSGSTWPEYFSGDYEEKVTIATPFNKIKSRLNSELLPESYLVKTQNSTSIQNIVLDYSDFKSTGVIHFEGRGDLFESRIFTNKYNLVECNFQGHELVDFLREENSKRQ